MRHGFFGSVVKGKNREHRTNDKSSILVTKKKKDAINDAMQYQSMSSTKAKIIYSCAHFGDFFFLSQAQVPLVFHGIPTSLTSIMRSQKRKEKEN